MVEKSVALDMIAGNPWTAIVLAFDGQIAEVVPFDAEPTAHAFLDFTRTRARGRRFRLIKQATLTEAELHAIIAAAMGTGEPTRTRDSDALGRTVEEWQSSLHPLSAVRSIADAIVNLVTRWSK